MTEGPGGRRVAARAAAMAAIALLVAVALWLYAWWVVGLAVFAGTTTAAVLMPGAAVAGAAALARRRGGPPRPVPVRAGARRWAVLAVATLAWQLQAYFQHPRPDHPTISYLVNTYVLDTHTARAVAFLAWLALGVYLVRR